MLFAMLNFKNFESEYDHKFCKRAHLQLLQTKIVELQEYKNELMRRTHAFYTSAKVFLKINDEKYMLHIYILLVIFITISH